MLRDAIADQLNSAVGGVIDTIMKGIWAASVWLLRSVFELVDSFTTLNFVSVDGGIDPTSPIATIWPLMRWVSLVIATGLFFLQLATTMLRGGRGMFRLATGPLAYAIAVGMTAGGIGLLFAAGDGLTTMMLDQGLKADGFVGVLDSPAAAKFFIPAPNLDAPTSALDPVSPQARAESAGALASQLDATTRAVVLGIVAVFAVIPAGLGFLLENIFRLAVFAVLVATSPVTAAGLLADATASWFWRGLRWAITAAVLKPALALVLIIGVNMLSRPTGLSGLLAAAGVLLVALFCPFALYRLLAFVDPGTNAGMTARGFLNTSGLSGGGSGGGAGGGSGSDGSGGGDGGEAAHAARFDAAGGGEVPAARARAAPGPGELGPALVAGVQPRRVLAPLASSPVWVPRWRRPASSPASTPTRRWTPPASVIRTAAAAAPPPPPGRRQRPGRWRLRPAAGGSGGPDDNGPDASSTLATAPEYGDHDVPPDPGFDPDYDDDPGSGYGPGYGYDPGDPAMLPAHAPATGTSTGGAGGAGGAAAGGP